MRGRWQELSVEQHLRLCTPGGRSDQIQCPPQQDKLQAMRLAAVSQSPMGKPGGGGVPPSGS